MKKNSKENDFALLKIVGLAYNGFGIGKFIKSEESDKITFVDYACTDDLLRVKIYEEHKRYNFGKIDEIIAPSPIRIKPVCPHFTICGGCNYLNIPYDYEIYWKKKIFENEFKKMRSSIKSEDCKSANEHKKQENYNNHKNYANFGNKENISNVNLENYANKNHENICNDENIEFSKYFPENLQESLTEKIDIIKSDDFLHYRQKISLKVYSDESIGFFKKNSHYVVDVDYCYLASNEINIMIKKVRNFFLENNQNLLKKVKSIILTYTGIENAIFQLKEELSGKEKKLLLNLDINKIYIEFNKIINESLNNNTDNNTNNNIDTDKDYFAINEVKFAHEVLSFIQVNKKQNEYLINFIVDYLINYLKTYNNNYKNNKNDYKFESVLDLYCGYGNITFFTIPFTSNVIGVESNPYSIKLANKNIILNNDLIKYCKSGRQEKKLNISFINENVEDFLRNSVKNNLIYDLIIIDPPRAGIKGLVPHIIKLNPEVVIYVSCDPLTLLRDLKVFISEGYFIDDIKLIDMFPRTYHIESLVFLNRKKIDKK
ncbi:MAG: class I SAM-dependent RNA methyltransferase [Candidatus Acididesulfobacter diazotrophicus]|jgi:23S rRNA (uracil1939-C5)-methyltransferase|uniref:Class I SAM-dependent RNA methyltransferase n=1 Tax=Candidatus Acididesulfobacter diazotrophicus TaxID=2597226 RepID=A0A519BPD3_9DELT|nr:MAG: class I SAM-dependent RNA methyltransferase [Candidatus Acididesulfobacter diazotrophicus]